MKTILLASIPFIIDSTKVLEILTSSSQYRIFQNTSKGLESTDKYKHQCDDSQKYTAHSSGNRQAMSFTPNRISQQDSLLNGLQGQMQSCVVLALGAHSNQPHYDYGPAGSLNGLMSVWDSWIDNFFSQVSNTTALIMLLDERDYKRQNVTNTPSDYVNMILDKNMGLKPANCVTLRQQLHYSKNRFKKKFTQDNCQQANWLNFDQGYYVYSYDYSVVNTSNPLNYQTPLIVFASVFQFPRPEWAKSENEEELFIHWRPRRLNRRYPTNYGYVKMTNWYSYHMLNLKILDFFDYGIKLDNDVSFVQPFPIQNIPLRMAELQAKMLITTQDWYYDDPRICQGIRLCLNAYLKQENNLCKKQIASDLIPGGINYTVFWENNLNATFRSHFVIFWLGIYTAPQTKQFAKFWNDWDPRGMWDYRWGDQQYWPRPLQLFGNGNLSQEIYHYNEINSENEKLVVHKLWPLQWTVSSTNYFNYSGSDKTTRQALYKIASKKLLKLKRK